MKRISGCWMKLLFVVACLATFIFIAWQITNLRGRMAWNNYRKAAIERGEPMDLKSIIPPPVPDASNFASIAFFRPLFNFAPGTQKIADTNAFEAASRYFDALNSIESGAKRPEQSFSNTWVTGPKPLSRIALEILKQSGETNQISEEMSNKESASTILTFLEQYNEAITQIEEAAKRPHTRFPIAYEHTPSIAVILPHLNVLKRISTLLQLRACANLSAGNAIAAEKDVHLIFRAAEGPKNEPILISHLVRLAMLHVSLQAITEGISRGEWSDQQLAGFQERLLAFDLRPELQRTIRGEMIFFGINTIDAMRRGEISGGVNDMEFKGMRRLPDGWFYYEMLNYHKTLSEYANASLPDRPVDPQKIRELSDKYDPKGGSGLRRLWNHDLFSGMLVPAMTKMVERTTRSQTGLQLAGLACALERYRIEHGNYPETLEELKTVPASKRADLVLGGPLHYKREGADSYALYSVGWNTTDDGGALSTEGKRSERQDLDWVWRPLPREPKE